MPPKEPVVVLDESSGAILKELVETLLPIVRADLIQRGLLRTAKPVVNQHEHRLLRITSIDAGDLDAEGRYPGKLVRYQSSDDSRSDLADVWVAPGDGATALSVAHYHGQRWGVSAADGLPVFTVVPGTGAGGTGNVILVEEEDGDPSLTCSKLIFDQADGFSLSQPGAGEVLVNLTVGAGIRIQESDGSPDLSGIIRIYLDQSDGFQLSLFDTGEAMIDLLSASQTQKGIVDLSTQHFAGLKLFHDGGEANDGWTFNSCVVWVQGDGSSGGTGIGQIRYAGDVDHTTTGSTSALYDATATLITSLGSDDNSNHYRMNYGRLNTSGHFPGQGTAGVGYYGEWVTDGNGHFAFVICGDGPDGGPRYGVYDASGATLSMGTTGTFVDNNGNTVTVKGGIITALT